MSEHPRCLGGLADHCPSEKEVRLGLAGDCLPLRASSEMLAGLRTRESGRVLGQAARPARIEISDLAVLAKRDSFSPRFASPRPERAR